MLKILNFSATITYNYSSLIEILHNLFVLMDFFVLKLDFRSL
jgi:hypothetical protein